MSRVQKILLGEDAHDVRLDRFVRRDFPHVSQGRIEKLCRKGEIRVDGGRVKAATRLQAGQELRLPPLPDAPAPAVQTAPRISDADAQEIRAAVLYRDETVIALNKPAGLAVQGGSGTVRHVDMLAPALQFDAPSPPRLVHRLDKDTSGVLLLARSAQAADGLARAFRARTARKIYWALVAGLPEPRMGRLQWGLLKAPGHGPNQAGERMRCVHPNLVEDTPGAKHATTDYAVMDALGTRAAWVGLVPVTGRTHQLRAHMAELGHPIAGDGKYGGSKQENAGDGWGAGFGGGLSRKLHLHARHLRITHPMSGAELRFTAPLPEHMARSWDFFGWNIADAPEDPFEEE